MEQSSMVFIASGDSVLCNFLLESLTLSGILATISANLTEAVEKAENLDHPACIIFDAAYAGEITRAANARILTLFFNNSDSAREISGVSARNILMPPLRMGILIDRIHAHLNAANHFRKAERIAIGPYILMPEQNLLTGESGTIRITERECDILVRLAEANGSAIDRQTLLSELWGYVEETETHTLETHIYRLRQKIEADPANPRYLLTVETGYRLSGN